MGGMSEFFMMTQGIHWPIDYGAFLLGAALIGVLTFTALKRLETRQLKLKKLR